MLLLDFSLGVAGGGVIGGGGGRRLGYRGYEELGGHKGAGWKWTWGGGEEGTWVVLRGCGCW